MERTTSLVERLKEIEDALGANERARARDLLVAIRDAQGPSPAGLSAQISALSDDEADLDAVVGWVEEALFEQSLSADLSADSDWLEVGDEGDEASSSGVSDSADAADEVNLDEWDAFDAFDDFDGFDLGDVDAPAEESSASSSAEVVGGEEQSGRADQWCEESTRRLDASAAAGLADSARGAAKPQAAEVRDSDPFAGLNLFGDADEEESASDGDEEEEKKDADAKKERARGLSGLFKVPPPTATGVDPVSVFQNSEGEQAEPGEPSQAESAGVRETKQYAAASREDEREPTAVATGALSGERGEDPFADLDDVGDEKAEREPRSPRERASFDSGPSVARYAGVEPPPPSHRLRQASSPDVKLEIADESSGNDDLDFDLGFERPAGVDSRLGTPSEAVMADESDLGLSAPEPTRGAAKAVQGGDDGRADAEDDDLDFDLGFSNPAQPTESTRQVEGATRAEAGLGSDSSQAPPPAAEQREERQTPVSQVPAVSRGVASVDEDEFFALAESLAAESSGATEQPYRGEPVVRERPSRTPSGETHDVGKSAGNDFAHDAPTGVRHAFVESSFVLEELSSAAGDEVLDSNLAAILLEARRLYENGAFVESLEIVDKVLSRTSNEEARELRGSIQREMERALLDDLGSMSAVPRLAIGLGDLASLDLDHRAGYILSQVDGMMSYEDLIELSGMPRLETMQVIADLLKKGVLTTG